MAVDVGHRTETKRKFEAEALKLLKHTAIVVSNENIFLPKFDKVVTSDILYDAKNIYLNVIKANRIHVKEKGDGTAEQRLKLQREALRLCKDLIDNITIAKAIMHLSTRKCGYWVHLVNCAYDAIEKWHSSDVNRYRALI